MEIAIVTVMNKKLLLMKDGDDLWENGDLTIVDLLSYQPSSAATAPVVVEELQC